MIVGVSAAAVYLVLCVASTEHDGRALCNALLCYVAVYCSSGAALYYILTLIGLLQIMLIQVYEDAAGAQRPCRCTSSCGMVAIESFVQY
jgi:hypothetical protein